MTKSNGHPAIKIPAPTLTILHIILAILLAWQAPLPIPAPALIRNIGLGFALLGFLVGILALREFKRVRTPYDLGNPMKSRITSGVYQYTRNPVYLGFVFMLIGLPLSMGTYWGVILAWPLITLMNKLIIEPEETSLRNEFSAQFEDYSSRVRRWL